MPVNITIKSVGSPPKSAKGLPITLTFHEKTAQQITISQVKSALQAKFPRVGFEYISRSYPTLN